MEYIIYKGTEKEFRCNSIKALAKYVGISESNVQSRVHDWKYSHKFETLEEAIEYDKVEARRKKNRKTVFKGTDKEFTGTNAEIANHFNIEYRYLSTAYGGTLEDRILKAIEKNNSANNLSDQEALDMLIKLFNGSGNDIKKNQIKQILKG